MSSKLEFIKAWRAKKRQIMQTMVIIALSKLEKIISKFKSSYLSNFIVCYEASKLEAVFTSNVHKHIGNSLKAVLLQVIRRKTYEHMNIPFDQVLLGYALLFQISCSWAALNLAASYAGRPPKCHCIKKK